MTFVPFNRLVFALTFATLLTLANGLRAEPVNITFLLVSDIYKMSGSKVRGGFSRLAAVVKAERGKGGNVVYVHAGDTISPSLMSGFDQGEHIIELLNMAPPDYFIPGNHEFDFGADLFLKRMAQAKFAKLAANLRAADGTPIAGIEDTKILQFGDLKVGLIGLTADDSPVKSSPGDLKFAPTIKTGVDLARQMRKDGVDFIVAIAHANRSQDRALFASRAFDLILTGDDHDLALFFDGRTAMVESKEEGEFVTAVDLSLTISESRGRRRVNWWPNFRIIDTANVEPDPEVQARVAHFEGELSKELDVVIGTSITEMDSRKASVRTGETPIGNLIADAMRQAVGADICITNGGGIRGNKIYAPGAQITRRDVLTELPFGNKNMLLEVDGKTILAALENGLSLVEDAAGRFPHVSGIVVKTDITKPSGSRVVSVTVGDIPLDPDKKYKLATNDFMARGGDGYGMFRKAKRLLGPLDAKLMANHPRLKRHVKPLLGPAQSIPQQPRSFMAMTIIGIALFQIGLRQPVKRSNQSLGFKLKTCQMAHHTGCQGVDIDRVIVIGGKSSNGRLPAHVIQGRESLVICCRGSCCTVLRVERRQEYAITTARLQSVETFTDARRTIAHGPIDNQALIHRRKSPAQTLPLGLGENSQGRIVLLFIPYPPIPLCGFSWPQR